MEAEDPPAGVGDQSPSNVVFPPAYFGPGGADCSEGVDVVTERTLLPGSQTPGLGLGCSPGWALSFFGEDCFSPEVVEYARSLGQHTGSAGLEVKTQVSDLVPSSTKSHDCRGQMTICFTFSALFSSGVDPFKIFTKKRFEVESVVCAFKSKLFRNGFT